MSAAAWRRIRSRRRSGSASTDRRADPTPLTPHLAPHRKDARGGTPAPLKTTPGREASGADSAPPFRTLPPSPFSLFLPQYRLPYLQTPYLLSASQARTAASRPRCPPIQPLRAPGSACLLSVSFPDISLITRCSVLLFRSFVRQFDKYQLPYNEGSNPPYRGAALAYANEFQARDRGKGHCSVACPPQPSGRLTFAAVCVARAVRAGGCAVGRVRAAVRRAGGLRALQQRVVRCAAAATPPPLPLLLDPVTALRIPHTRAATGLPDR